MIGDPRVGLPVGVDTICMGGGLDVPLIWNIVGIKAVLALCSIVPVLETDLALAIEARLLSTSVGHGVTTPASSIATATSF